MMFHYKKCFVRFAVGNHVLTAKLSVLMYIELSEAWEFVVIVCYDFFSLFLGCSVVEIMK